MRLISALLASAAAALAVSAAPSPNYEISKTSLSIDKHRQALDNGDIVIRVQRTDDLFSDPTAFQDARLLLEKNTHISLKIQLDPAAGTVNVNDEPLDITTHHPKVTAIRAEALRLPAEHGDAPLMDATTMKNLLAQMSPGIVGVEVKVESENIAPSVPVSSEDATSASQAMTIRKVGLWIRVIEVEGQALPHATTTYTPILQLIVTSSGNKVDKMETLFINGDNPMEGALNAPGPMMVGPGMLPETAAKVVPVDSAYRGNFRPRPPHRGPLHPIKKQRRPGFLSWLANLFGFSTPNPRIPFGLRGGRRGCRGMRIANSTRIGKHLETHRPLLENPFSGMIDEAAPEEAKPKHSLKPYYGYGRHFYDSLTMAPPSLRRIGKSIEWIVDDKPFLMLAGELQNSSMTSARYMRNIWPQLKENNYNTILGAVAWEDIEPEEGHFVFEELDQILHDVREAGMHLVLLWFGAFKNGCSDYVPSWIKKDIRRFPRAELRNKESSGTKLANALTIFNPKLATSDAAAFEALMLHLKEVDCDSSTVIAVQVENEIGLLGDSRDRCSLAEKTFTSAVPKELVSGLQGNWHSLRPELLEKTLNTVGLDGLAGDAERNWATLFGSTKSTDELFMAYHFAKYVEQIAAVGKKAYPIPLYTNVWQALGPDDANADMPAFISAIVAGGKEDEPGFFPSGGGTIRVLDIWQMFARSLDFVAPDVYLSDYEKSCEKYSHRGQPLFIPEQRRDDYGARRVWSALGTYNCLGCSPFGIDTLKPQDSSYTKHYGLLEKVAPLLLKYRQQGSTFGFFFDEIREGKDDVTPSRKVVFGEYELTVSRSFVFGKPTAGCGLVIHLGEEDFLLVGWGFQVEFKSTNPAARYTGILRFREMEIMDGSLKALRNLNGDETRSGQYAIMPSDDPDYGDFPVSVTIPANTYLAHCEAFFVR